MNGSLTLMRLDSIRYGCSEFVITKFGTGNNFVPVSSHSYTPLSQNAALQHLFIRKSFRPYKCTLCGKAFREKDKLEQHMRYHSREGCRYTCHQCNKGFLSSTVLEEHLQMHLEQRSYSCLFCAESYDRLELLKEHVSVHLVNGCFSCPSCKKTFTDFIQVSYSTCRVAFLDSLAME